MPSLQAAMDGACHGEAKATTKGAATTTTTVNTTTTLLSLLRVKTERSAEAEEKVEWVRSQLVGRDAEFDTPFGRHALVYADHTASGRSLRYIEDYILKHVLPFYGNTHTEDSYVGSRTTRMVRRAAQLRAEERWVVLVGPYEHHSNLLSWRRSLRAKNAD